MSRLARYIAYLTRRRSAIEDAEIIRDEIASTERLEALASVLAHAHSVSPWRISHRPLQRRLRDNEAVLLATYRAFGATVDAGEGITPAAEWLLENFHVVEEQIREIRQDLPPAYYRELPQLESGPFRGYPRVYGIAWAFVAHTDSRFEIPVLERFLVAYQAVSPLTIGELWAVAITLRIVLVENLRRAARRSQQARLARTAADEMADRLLGINGPPGRIPPDTQPLTTDFVAQLAHRLRGHDPDASGADRWLAERLARQGTSLDDAVAAEHQRQTMANVTMRNIITSMRLMSEVDWAELFESISLVEQALRRAPLYPSMDFVTRNLYRSAVERLGRHSPLTELKIATLASARAAAPSRTGADDESRRTEDPGFHLLAAGLPAFERLVQYRRPWHRCPGHWLRCHSTLSYFTGLGTLTAVLLGAGLGAVAQAAVAAPSPLTLACLAVVGLIPATELAISIVNRIVQQRVGTQVLPSLALRHGVPAEFRTMVAVPSLLTSVASVNEQVGRLEIHHLASLGGAVHFALLTDGLDADAATIDGDDALLAAAAAGIARLNQAYAGDAGEPRFFLLHRRRTWNATERTWMGWERKRGKLHELNQLLRGSTDTHFVSTDGQPVTVPAGVRFVITLDADTRLPRDTVRRLIGKLAHPQNRPRFDVERGRIVEGYAILQPRVTPSLPVERSNSLFQRVFTSVAGLDPYAAAASDVYQDLFGEGSYSGKGIYDIDAFETALAGRVGPDSLLSHDLFEGLYARAGLAADVEVVEDFPDRYDDAARRQHRWARGDWQLLPWITGRGDAGDRAVGRDTALPFVSQWKMIDNLRRSLVAPAAFAALLVGWTRPWPQAVVWTGGVVATLVLPVLASVLSAVLPARSGVSLRSHGRAFWRDLWLALLQSLLVVVFLAHQAWLMTDAMIRSLYRLGVSRRHLLQWVSAAESGARAGRGLARMHRYMTGGLVLALIVLCASPTVFSAARYLVWSFALLWLLAPLIAYATSRDNGRLPRPAVSVTEARALRDVARRTWRYFETFVTAADHHLPPDNVQEDPILAVAHRTSPTNMGLYLLATVSACDFGWISRTEMADRLDATLTSMASLRRYRGHFFNWYDTSDLRVLDPGYVSSVDSGNLAAHLVTASMACREADEVGHGSLVALEGVRDALGLARLAAALLPPATPAGRALGDDYAVALRETALALAAGLAPAADRVDAFRRALGPAVVMADVARALHHGHPDPVHEDLVFWSEAVRRAIDSHLSDLLLGEDARAVRQARLAAMASTLKAMAMAMDFAFLFNTERRLLSIGYRPDDQSLDYNCYDLLASESRLASFFAIAKGDVPARHWFRLGRSVTLAGRGAALISWSGSMFEYLMPSLVMREPAASIIAQTNDLIVRRQIDYAGQLGLPWGISESAYNERDIDFTYQYSNFGIPDLGLKRGLRDNAVIAPYATALAAMLQPGSAVKNFQVLAAEGAEGRYGFIEALDFTPRRLPAGSRVALVRAFMAHHQGMTVVAISNTLMQGRMRERFHASPSVRAAELLLHERPPRDITVSRPWVPERAPRLPTAESSTASTRRFTDPARSPLQTQLLTNGRYSALLTGSGSGYGRWHGIAVTRWREDAVCDDLGSFLYLHDLTTGAIWSPCQQPVALASATYEVTFAEERATFTCVTGSLTSTLEVLVSPEEDAEARCLTLINNGLETRLIEVTSYLEIVLAPLAADIAHPAFSKLFIETDYDAGSGALLATRRQRETTDVEIWASHHLVLDGEAAGPLSHETDRRRFLGRGRGPREAIEAAPAAPLSGTTGFVLDAIFSLRQAVRIAPGKTARLTFWTGVAPTRAAAVGLIDRHRGSNAFSRASLLAWTHAQVQLRHLGVAAADACLFQRLAGHLVYSQPDLRSASTAVASGRGGPRDLWALGISGDRPIVLLRIDDATDLGLVRELLLAHEYWQNKGLDVDLVVLNERASSYVQDLQNELDAAARTSQSRRRLPRAGATNSVFVFRADLLAPAQCELLRAIARIVLYAPRGTLVEQLDRRDRTAMPAPTRRWRTPLRHRPVELPPVTAGALAYFNGLGGFTDDGREYVTTLRDRQVTPAPWINVIANPGFGFQVAVEGSGYTWSVNSKENQLTPWSNDPVTDRSGEAIYLRDERSGEVWSPTASPVRLPNATYRARHGQGYSRFEHASHGVLSDMVQFVPVDDPVRIVRLRLTNRGDEARDLSVTTYAEWVLGTTRMPGAGSITTVIDPDCRALLATNGWNTAYGNRTAFADLGGAQTHWTADRTEFIGRGGSLALPAALRSSAMLSGRAGRTLDPCAVLQAPLHVEPGASVEVVYLLGDAAGVDEARAMVLKYRAADLDQVFGRVLAQWDDLLGEVTVLTPDRSFDLLMNRWLLYQTLSCRVWARSAFYQSGGAYGFRDQLQDGLALARARPALVREHLLRAAGRQFVEGDVQHWWLPHSGEGVRTRIADDRIWLGYCAARYVAATGDAGVLAETVPFLDGPVLHGGEHESFFAAVPSSTAASLYEHCALALDQSLAVGAHGLPLIGTGDWNDGLNRVGVLGQGESVWLAWFLCATIQAFLPHALARGDGARAERWQTHAAALRDALEQDGWDGRWYRRAFYDDGTPLGSATSDECCIDAIAQSWSVIAGGGDPARAAQAMASVESLLVRPDDGLVLLFTPPFDHAVRDPGYIKAYPPGVRENGGQYTHAGVWTVMALAEQGKGDAAHRLFSFLGPVHHASTRLGVERYRVEPYVVAADIYSVAPHAGRGGWTWYTGSAAWLYQAGLQAILGLRLEGNRLRMAPCLPRGWPRADVTWRYRTAVYAIAIENPSGVSVGVSAIRLDGTTLADGVDSVTLNDDGRLHTLVIRLGPDV